jgi:transcription initiation factor IIE alpha subunit
VSTLSHAICHRKNEKETRNILRQWINYYWNVSGRKYFTVKTLLLRGKQRMKEKVKAN